MTQDFGYKMWSQWMGLAQQGDSEAYRKLLNEIGPYTQKYLSRKMGGRPQVEDVTQETLLTVHRARHTFDATRPFKPWLHAVIQSRLMEFWRKQKRLEEKEIAQEDDQIFQLEAPAEIDAADVEDLRRALNQLTPSQKEIVMLIKFEGKSVKQVAEQLNITESSVKVTAHRGYKKLFEVLSE